jgi:hypothetical protein
MTSAAAVRLRRWPAPFRAALAIHSDADDASVEDWRRILSAFHDAGVPATGVLFMWAPPPQASWFDDPQGGRTRDADALASLVRSGMIDAVHGLGDYNDAPPPQRAFAERAFTALEQAGIRLSVWTNHGNPRNAQNLLCRSGFGDIPGSPHYIGDLLRAHGVRFVWPQYLTHVIGQDRPCRPAEHYRTYTDRPAWRRHLARIHPWIARRLNIEPFEDNALLRRTALRDGTPVFTFRRYGIWKRDAATDLEWMFTPDRLERLIKTGGACVTYIHLARRGPPPRKTIEAIASRAGDIWIAPVSRLLRFAAVRDALRWRTEPGRIVIERSEDPILGAIPSAEDLQLLSFEDPLRRRVEVVP